MEADGSLKLALDATQRAAVWAALLGVPDSGGTGGDPADAERDGGGAVSGAGGGGGHGELDARIASLPRDLDNQRVVAADVLRTRPELAFFRAAATRETVEAVLTYYAVCRGVVYRQGLNELVAVLMLASAGDAALADAFRGAGDAGGAEAGEALPELPRVQESRAFFMLSGLVSHFLPNLYGYDDDFVFLQVSFRLFRLLLAYHAPQLGSRLDQWDVPPELYATGWFLTLFARGTPPGLVMTLWDFLLVAGDPGLAHFVALALLMANEPAISRCGAAELPALMSRLTFSSAEQVAACCQHALVLRASTPRSFCEHIIAACVDVTLPPEEMIRLLESRFVMAIRVDELAESSLRAALTGGGHGGLTVDDDARISGAKPAQRAPDGDDGGGSGAEEGGIRYMVLDCRPSAEFEAGHLPLSLHVDPSLLGDDPERLADLLAGLGELRGCHFAVLGGGDASVLDAEEFGPLARVAGVDNAAGELEEDVAAAVDGAVEAASSGNGSLADETSASPVSPTSGGEGRTRSRSLAAQIAARRPRLRSLATLRRSRGASLSGVGVSGGDVDAVLTADDDALSDGAAAVATHALSSSPTAATATASPALSAPAASATNERRASALRTVSSDSAEVASGGVWGRALGGIVSGVSGALAGLVAREGDAGDVDALADADPAHMVAVLLLQKGFQHTSEVLGGYAALHEFCKRDLERLLVSHDPAGCVECADAPGGGAERQRFPSFAGIAAAVPSPRTRAASAASTPGASTPAAAATDAVQDDGKPPKPVTRRVRSFLRRRGRRMHRRWRGRRSGSGAHDWEDEADHLDAQCDELVAAAEGDASGPGTSDRSGAEDGSDEGGTEEGGESSDEDGDGNGTVDEDGSDAAGNLTADVVAMFDTATEGTLSWLRGVRASFSGEAGMAEPGADATATRLQQLEAVRGGARAEAARPPAAARHTTLELSKLGIAMVDGEPVALVSPPAEMHPSEESSAVAGGAVVGRGVVVFSARRVFRTGAVERRLLVLSRKQLVCLRVDGGSGGGDSADDAAGGAGGGEQPLAPGKALVEARANLARLVRVSTRKQARGLLAFHFTTASGKTQALVFMLGENDTACVAHVRARCRALASSTHP